MHRSRHRQHIAFGAIEILAEILRLERVDPRLGPLGMQNGQVELGPFARVVQADLPGGRDAALRELWEETGVRAERVTVVSETDRWLPYELPFDLVPKIWKGRFRGQEQKWFLMRFHGSDEDVNIETDHPEFSQWRWLPATDLVENIVPFKRDVYAAVLDAFAEHI